MEDSRLREAAQRSRMQIAIDGPAGAGKSTVGRVVAHQLGAMFLDTGLMYRAVAWLGLERGIRPDDAEGLAAIARSTEFSSAPGGRSLLVNGEDRERELRTTVVDNVVSEVSAHREVRRVLVEKQRMVADCQCVVMVGRDIGTTVLPDAPVKLWVTASPEERARRRLWESLEGSSQIDVSEMTNLIAARDALDASRPVSPLAKAPDAIAVDTESLGVDEAVQVAMAAIRRVLKRATSVDACADRQSER